MFSTKPLETFKQQLIILTPEEKGKLENYLLLVYYIQTNNAAKQAEILKTLGKYSDRDIYIFCENSKDFKSFIQSPDCPLTKDWPDYLKKKHCIGENLTALDGKKHTIYDEYMGAYLYHQYNKNKGTDKATALKYLDLACEFGLFQALKSRCINAQAKLNSTTDDRERLLAFGQIVQDSASLCNLYGSTGYFYSAKFLHYVGNYFASRKKSEFAGTASYFHRAAAENFFYGKELLQNHHLPENEKILKAICGDAGLLHFGFKSWEAAEKHFLKPINNKMTPHHDIKSDAKKKVEKLQAESKDHSL